MLVFQVILCDPVGHIGDLLVQGTDLGVLGLGFVVDAHLVLGQLELELLDALSQLVVLGLPVFGVELFTG